MIIVWAKFSVSYLYFVSHHLYQLFVEWFLQWICIKGIFDKWPQPWFLVGIKQSRCSRFDLRTNTTLFFPMSVWHVNHSVELCYTHFIMGLISKRWDSVSTILLCIMRPDLWWKKIYINGNWGFVPYTSAFSLLLLFVIIRLKVSAVLGHRT